MASAIVELAQEVSYSLGAIEHRKPLEVCKCTVIEWKLTA